MAAQISVPYLCPSCGARIGDLVPYNSWVRLDAGGWLIGDGVQYCHRCGRLHHFKAPRETWAEMIARIGQKPMGAV